MTSRLPAAELMIDPIRSGIGYFSRRKDIAALAIVFSFGALLNAFGMVSPVYALEAWLQRLLSVSHRAPVLAIIFVVFLVVEPAILLGGAAWLTRALGGSKLALVPLAVRYSYALVPLGFGMWLAHYGFHFFTGILTIVPVTQAAACQSRCAFSWRAALDVDGFADAVCAADRNGIFAAGICRFASRGAPTGGRGLP